MTINEYINLLGNDSLQGRDGGADRKLDKLCYQAKMLPIFPRAAAS